MPHISEAMQQGRLCIARIGIEGLKGSFARRHDNDLVMSMLETRLLRWLWRVTVLVSGRDLER
jgi:hypothetical protein